MKTFRYFAAGALIALCATAAIAQTPAPPDTTVTVPWGDLISNARDLAIGSAVVVIGWAMRKLPAAWLQMLRTAQVEQLLERAITYGINATADAVQGQTLRVDVGNKAVANALQYITDHAPGWLITWMGGNAAIKEKIIARLDIEPAAKVVNDAARGPVLVAPPK